MIIFMLMIVILISLILIVAFGSSRNVKTSSDFFFGANQSKKFGFGNNAALTNFNLTAALIITPQLSMTYGFDSIWIIASGALGILIFGIPGLLPIPREDPSRPTIHSYLAGTGIIGRTTKTLAAVITIISLTSTVGITMASLGSILSKFLGGEIYYWVIFLFLFTGTYLALAGFEVIRKVDYI